MKIECAYQADEKVQYGGPWGEYPHVAVSEGLDPDCVAPTSRQETITVTDFPEQTIPAVTHEEIVVDVPESVDPDTGEVIPAVTHTETVVDTPEQTVPAVTHDEQITVYELEEDEDLVAAKAVATKQTLVSEAYDDMNTDVFAQMETVFGTARADSASAYFETWKLMADNPSLFSGEGLKADKTISTFTLGDALDTNQKVQDFANARIAEANAYSVYRMKRIETFRVERAAILSA